MDGVTEYTYDSLGQLLTEAVNGINKNTMVYDSYGNIRSKNGVAYTYGDSTWKDLLTKVGDQTITYDAQGNPTSYLGHTLTWEKGRQLKSFDDIQYTYNANGIRISKLVDGILHSYELEGERILREVWDNNTLIPLYDNEYMICGIIHNGAPYYFQKDLQGNVVGIVNADTEVVAMYTYDAFGYSTIVLIYQKLGLALLILLGIADVILMSIQDCIICRAVFMTRTLEDILMLMRLKPSALILMYCCLMFLRIAKTTWLTNLMKAECFLSTICLRKLADF